MHRGAAPVEGLDDPQALFRFHGQAKCQGIVHDALQAVHRCAQSQRRYRIPVTSTAKALNPELTFKFGEDNIARLQELLVTMQANQFDIASASGSPVFDVFASVIIEAMQFAHIIPSPQETQLAELAKELEVCTRVNGFLERCLELSDEGEDLSALNST